MDVPGHKTSASFSGGSQFGQASNHTQDLPAKLPVKAKAWGLNSHCLGLGGRKVV
jgi:hypothetical protein